MGEHPRLELRLAVSRDVAALLSQPVRRPLPGVGEGDIAGCPGLRVLEPALDLLERPRRSLTLLLQVLLESEDLPRRALLGPVSRRLDRLLRPVVGLPVRGRFSGGGRR